jgi:hypothetical protein
MIDAYKILVGKSEGKNHLEGLGLSSKVISKSILKTKDMSLW